MIQFIADAEPTAMTTPDYTALMVGPHDTLWINAYERLVTLTYAYPDGVNLIREIPVGYLSGLSPMERAFDERDAAIALGYTQRGTDVWSIDPWDAVSVLDAPASF
jgi:hypothetical protein